MDEPSEQDLCAKCGKLVPASPRSILWHKSNQIGIYHAECAPQPHPDSELARLRSELSSIRSTTIEECAKLADRIAAAYNDDKDGDADARVAAEWVASEIRSLSQPKPGKE